MNHMDRHLKINRIWFPIFLFILVLLYATWWILFIYMPYSDKKDVLQPQIFGLQREIAQKRVNLEKAKKADERLITSMAPMRSIQARLPFWEDMPNYVRLLKKRGKKWNLNVEQKGSTPYMSASPYPTEILIHPMNLTFELKGDFYSIGKFLQSLDEEDRHFCHIRSVTLERSSSKKYHVLAVIKLEIYCQRTQGENNGLS